MVTDLVTLTWRLTANRVGQPSVELTKQLGEAKVKLDKLRTHAEWLKIQRVLMSTILRNSCGGAIYQQRVLTIQDLVKFYASDSRANKNSSHGHFRKRSCRWSVRGGRY
jgi:hypothetical protein